MVPRNARPAHKPNATTTESHTDRVNERLSDSRTAAALADSMQK
jgi:hypothetical protein